jgi:hypothetical protein
VISHVQEDFYEKTCREILERSPIFRPAVIDCYSHQFREHLKKLMKSKRLVTDLGEIIRATYSGEVIRLILPIDKKLWGRIDPETREFTIHKRVNKRTSIDILNELAEEVVKDGGKIQVLRPHFFPEGTSVLAILKGRL